MIKVAFTTITAIAIAIAFAEHSRAQEQSGPFTPVGKRTVSVLCEHEGPGIRTDRCIVSLYTTQEHDRVKQNLESLILNQANTLSADLAASETIRALQGRIEVLEEKLRRLEQVGTR